MPNNDGQVVFEITGDNKPMKQALDDTTAAIEKESKKWDKTTDQTTDSMGSSFTTMFKTISAAAVAAKVGQVLMDWGKQAIQAASDLEEVQNVVDVTFGENGAAKIDAWAKTAITQFGLTETQAKRFTSTLGAMMKSAGMAGPEIVTMSEDLAGLAADMASFYNLDFDTAFQKIRSGISGETEPLKQLGINMSVANLQAFAMTQGITKAFDKMSQGEQTMLRYQYLMQATADAQGDFARTSDGYANGLRLLETNIDSLKTRLGTVLIPAVSSAVEALNGFLDSIMPDESKRTVLDQFNDIDINTAEKLAEIQQTATEAEALIGTLERIQGDVAAKNLEDVADAAGKLELGAGTKWGALITALGKAGVIKDTFDGDMEGAADTLWSLAYTLNNNSPDADKTAAWNSLLSTLTANAEGLSALTGTSVEETRDWLAGLAEGANALDPTKAESWETLFTALTEGLPGLNGSEAGQSFFEALGGQFLAMGTESEEARAGLASLGLTTDEIDIKQKQWLETCRRLVNTIPGLAEVINTETGEVKGGTDAISEYVEEWQKGQEALMLWKAHYAKVEANEERKQAQYKYELEKINAEARVEMLNQQFSQLGGWKLFDEYFNDDGLPTKRLSDEAAQMSGVYVKLQAAEKELAEATENYNAQVEANLASDELLAQEKINLTARFGEQAQAAHDAADATRALTEEQQAAAQTALSQLGPALEALNDYYEDARKATEQAVNSTIGGFEKIITPAQKVKAQVDDLRKTVVDASKQGEIDIKIANAESTIPTIHSMTEALRQQLEFINEYQKNLDEARRRGVSDELLASLSDGSVESADYLAALANASKGEITALNQAYADVNKGKETFTDTLTAQKLAADETFQGIVDKANEMVTALDMADGTKDALQSTVEGMASGIAAAIPDLTAQVDAVIAQMQRLETFGGFNFGGGAFTFGGSSGGLDYSALGDTIKGSAPKAGGNVYLNGKAVGAVVGAEMANSYRSLDRSGYQAVQD